jgi:hypothetical protein
MRPNSGSLGKCTSIPDLVTPIRTPNIGRSQVYAEIRQSTESNDCSGFWTCGNGHGLGALPWHAGGQGFESPQLHFFASGDMLNFQNPYLLSVGCL